MKLYITHIRSYTINNLSAITSLIRYVTGCLYFGAYRACHTLHITFVCSKFYTSFSQCLFDSVRRITDTLLLLRT